MKKSSLTTAVLAGLAGVVGFAGSSNAVELNPDGTGQVLIYPYYTVNAGQQTLMTVVNSTEFGKAVKVRFLEGYNSIEVLDFNLFLSPFDVWTANIFAMDDFGLGSTGAAVGTADMSCTVPSFAGLPTMGALHYQPFSNILFSGANSDSGPTGVERTRQGYAELITMADVTGDTLDAITHVDGVPPGCGSPLLRAVSADYVAPSGGLFGNGAIIDVADGSMYSYAADAIDGFTDIPLFTDSGSTTPSLQQANGGDGGLPGATAYVFIGGGSLQALDYPAGQEIDAVSAVFQASALLNEWVASTGFGTDWVVTFPTKRFYVNGAVAIDPFVETFGESAPGQSCTVIDATVYNREEGNLVNVPGDIFSPSPPGAPPSSICHEVNVVTISDPADPVSVLGAPYLAPDGATAGLAVNIPPYGDAGWLYLDLNPASEPHQLRYANGGTTSLAGLPATGFAAERFINEDIGGGILANYAGAYRHRAERTLLVS